MLYQPPLKGANLFNIVTENEYVFRLHWHFEIEVLYCIKGRFSYQVGSRTYSVKQGEYLIVSSAVDHIHKDMDPNTSTLVVVFGSALLGENFSYLMYRMFEPKSNNENIKRILEEVYTVFKRKDPAGRWLVKSCLMRLAALMLDELDSEEVNPSSYAGKFRRVTVIKPVLDYITEDYAKPISIEEAADIAHYGVKSFCRSFKQTTGSTFHQYLNAYRVEKACLLLCDRTLSIGDVGKQCGMGVPKTFSRLFRQHTGMMPSEYRDTHTK